ncbi:hypothetical protein QFI91_06880 [Raoultella sp. WB_B2P2-3]|uniref:hypothetical protein n=1 Tax=Raoultella scottii TaxID=3040937 RepID=UPI002F92DD66
MAPVLDQSYSVFGYGRRSQLYVLGWKMSRNGIRALVIVSLLMIPFWVVSANFLISLWRVFHG